MSFLATVLALAISARAEVVDRVAAVVNDEVITLSEVYELGTDYIEQRVDQAGGGPQARRDVEIEVLDSLILRKLITQEITRLDLDVSDQELDRTVDDIARRNGIDRDTLKVEVERSGLPWTQYRTELKENLRQTKFSQVVIRPRISVDEDELLDAYKRLTSPDKLPQIATLSGIMLPWPKASAPAEGTGGGTDPRQAVVDLAAELHARVLAEGLEAVAQAVADNEHVAVAGAMGSYRQGELAEELDGLVFQLPLGTVTEPVQTSVGVFVLRIDDRRPEEAPSFESVRDQLFEQVYADRIDDETDQWYRQTRRRSAVAVKLEPIVEEPKP